MTKRETGTVKWFDISKGYGFITCEDGRQVFVHHSDVLDKDARLKSAQRVNFTIIQEPKGPRAKDVTIQTRAIEPESPAISSPSYRFNQTLTLEEDREHEFKGLQRSKDPVKTISDYYVAEYVNAFLNTNGGIIYFGIENDGRVQGIQLDRSQRDDLRTRISKVINKFQPSVEPDLYKVSFVPVLGRESACVVEIQVCKGTASLYMTGSQNFYLRRDGSNFLMPFDLIRARLQSAPEQVTLGATAQAPIDVINVAREGAKPTAEDASFDLDLGILLAMVFMSWSDKQISEEELQLIQEKAKDEGLDEQEVSILMQATIQPPLLETIVSYLPTPESRKAAATIAYLVAWSDSVLTAQELDAFNTMCAALGLSSSERDEIRELGDRKIRREQAQNDREVQPED